MAENVWELCLNSVWTVLGHACCSLSTVSPGHVPSNDFHHVRWPLFRCKCCSAGELVWSKSWEASVKECQRIFKSGQSGQSGRSGCFWIWSCNCFINSSVAWTLSPRAAPQFWVWIRIRDLPHTGALVDWDRQSDSRVCSGCGLILGVEHELSIKLSLFKAITWGTNFANFQSSQSLQSYKWKSLLTHLNIP